MSHKGRVFVVEDEPNVAAVMGALLERGGFSVRLFSGGVRSIESLDEEIEIEDPDLLISDLNMPHVDGMRILAHCQKNHPELPVVMVTAFGTVESAVTALKKGAFDYITKPFEQTELLLCAMKAVEAGRKSRLELQVEPDATGEVREGGEPAVSSMMGRSAPMREIFRVISKVAASPSTVLIQGESGTGKELVAFEIHRNSPRAGKPFVKINCAAIPATLIESEFFGHERGAFTGAVGAKPGRFELAHEGTLFLDEVADMPAEMQVKLLRAVQEQEFERVGGVETKRVDVRLIAATNKDLETEVKAGRFREDLFYRLNVVPICIPPLRDRRDDIDSLVQVFVQKFNQKLGRSIGALHPLVKTALREFSWPGNIRQLENVVERMVLMSEGEQLLVQDLPLEIRSAVLGGHFGDGEGLPEGREEEGESPNLKEIVRRRTQALEKELIEQALVETEGNVTRASEKLGLSRKGLQLKMKELGVKRPE
jgi:two-component system response regulator AtoC